MTRRRWVLTAIAAAASALLWAGTAGAQLEDHLKCYKVKDPLKLKGPAGGVPWLDLTGTQFGSEDCRIVGGFRLMCVPVSKTVTQEVERKFLPPGGSFEPFDPAELAAPPAPGDRMCYKIKCAGDKFPAPPNPSQEVSDQFGTRTLDKLKPFLVCTPAVKGNDITVKGFKGFPATGEVTSFGAGSDGDVQAGAPLSYTDNGDGTITDLNTGLMWEKKDDNDAGSVHDRSNTYTWSTGTNNLDGTVATTFLDRLNNFCDDDEATACTADTDCVGAADTYASNDLCGHAGQRDWRLPNIKELQSIVDYEVNSPALDPVFNTACAGGCTVLTCSCDASSFYWSATSFSGFPTLAWELFSNDGTVFGIDKTFGDFARAVRGGL